MEALPQAFEGLTEDTKDIVIRATKAELTRVLNAIACDVKILSPPLPLIFNSFKLTPVENIKVVLIGQDPYIKPGEAMGLSFSVPRGVKIPPSLQNIYKCLCTRGLVAKIPTHGDLTYWAQQGVLLLNMALTTRIGQSGAHPEWAAYTSAVIHGICQRERPISFILLGNDAHACIIPKPHIVHKWGHPSPLSRVNQQPCDENFQNCPCFEAVNRDLAFIGEAPICWDPDGFLGAPMQAPLAVVHADAYAYANASTPVATPKIIAPFIYAPAVPPTTATPAPQRDIWPHGTVTKTRRVTPSDPQPTTGNVLYVFTDGGAYHNGYADCVASWACFITDGTTLCIASARVQPCDLGQVYKTSNQRGELSAILHALNYVESADVFVYTHIMVVSDSKYSIDCIESWAPKWRAKAGVVRGQPVVDKAAFSKYKNTDLIFPALEVTARLRTKYKVEFKHQLAHQTAVPTDPMLCFLHKGNQIVDGACSLLLPQ